MMAHVMYPAVDVRPAGYSRIWIEDILRTEFGFRGAVIGDDIGMAAAESHGSIATRIEGHLLAGCDLLLACNPAIVDEAIAASAHATPCDADILRRLQGEVAQTWDALAANPQRDEFIARLAVDTHTVEEVERRS